MRFRNISHECTLITICVMYLFIISPAPIHLCITSFDLNVKRGKHIHLTFSHWLMQSTLIICKLNFVMGFCHVVFTEFCMYTIKSRASKISCSTWIISFAKCCTCTHKILFYQFMKTASFKNNIVLFYEKKKVIHVYYISHNKKQGQQVYEGCFMA